jgi:hypothetical protein
LFFLFQNNADSYQFNSDRSSLRSEKSSAFSLCPVGLARIPLQNHAVPHDGLAVGALIAALLRSPERATWLRRFAGPGLGISLALTASLILCHPAAFYSVTVFREI